jgi:hypothetical protein
VIAHIADAWEALFSWLVYPVRIPFATLAGVVALRVLLRWVLPALSEPLRVCGHGVMALAGLALAAPESLYSRRMLAGRLPVTTVPTSMGRG